MGMLFAGMGESGLMGGTKAIGPLVVAKEGVNNVKMSEGVAGHSRSC